MSRLEPATVVAPGPGAGPFGVYVHVPFCASRCDYCAFATWTDRDHLMADYAEACVQEMLRARSEEAIPEATSVFVGGGTPSRLDGALFGRVLDAIGRHPDAEVTAECNPEGASAELFGHWRAAGVTRVSFGVQSMVPHVLESLGRHHLPSSVAPAVALAAEAGFEVNVDLIFGAAAEDDGDWERTLAEVLALDPRPRHVSAYALTVEPGTPLARDPARHPDDDVQARRYRRADAVLEAAGMRWYEVSNWAVPGYECRHNLLYWAQGDYRGVGCAAHSHRQGRRWWNIRTPERYVAAVRAGRSTTAGEEHLDDHQRAFEALALALRTSGGVPGEAVPDDPDLEGLVDMEGGRAVLTARGRLLANAVTARLQVPTILRP
ncbi:MAG TPA: radical SAM family heme chaperone HemW [Acidimicrobiales bacterium]|nr:radical SAM family heme chaperone HemW [Acidimicrobiales bacterium]